MRQSVCACGSRVEIAGGGVVTASRGNAADPCPRDAAGALWNAHGNACVRATPADGSRIRASHGRCLRRRASGHASDGAGVLFARVAKGRLGSWRGGAGRAHGASLCLLVRRFATSRVSCCLHVAFFLSLFFLCPRLFTLSANAVCCPLRAPQYHALVVRAPRTRQRARLSFSSGFVAMMMITRDRWCWPFRPVLLHGGSNLDPSAALHWAISASPRRRRRRLPISSGGTRSHALSSWVRTYVTAPELSAPARRTTHVSARANAPGPAPRRTHARYLVAVPTNARAGIPAGAVRRARPAIEAVCESARCGLAWGVGGAACVLSRAQQRAREDDVHTSDFGCRHQRA